MTRPPAIFDAWIHPALLPDEDLRDLAWFGVEGAVAALGDEVRGSDAEELLAACEGLVSRVPARLRAAGIAPFVALGIHPRWMPERGLERVLAELPAFFDKARVVAIGPVGLEAGGAAEEALLLRQIELAQRLQSRLVLRTPGAEKAKVTRRLLAILRESAIEPSRVLVGQVNEQTVRLVRACGHAACLSVGPLHLRAEEAVELVRRFGSTNLLLASEAGAGAGDLVALPRTVHLLEQAGLAPEIVRRVSRSNALAFFGIDPRAVQKRS